MRIKWWLLFIRGVNTRRDIQLEKIVSEYDAKGGGIKRFFFTLYTRRTELNRSCIRVVLSKVPARGRW